jgi:hypothetical protein
VANYASCGEIMVEIAIVVWAVDDARLPLRRLFFGLGPRSSGGGRGRVGGCLGEDGEGYDVGGGGVVAQT